ncbi:MAG TPA: preprotein translocase subunit SecG [Magnetospirillaceae bacterium]|nr:preprotein translocase subunit SecG [Magnetospirillaceae bacterium]
MGLLSVILLVFFIIISILLVLLVVIQDSDGDDLGGIFSGASSSAFGSRATSVVVKFTYILGGLFFVFAFSLALLNRTPAGSVEAAALRRTGETTTEWWSSEGQAAAPLQEAPASPDQPAPRPGN